MLSNSVGSSSSFSPSLYSSGISSIESVEMSSSDFIFPLDNFLDQLCPEGQPIQEITPFTEITIKREIDLFSSDVSVMELEDAPKDDHESEDLLDTIHLHPPMEGVAAPRPGRPTKKLKNVRKSNCYHCVVCGDKPTGYHYDVLSCNGCKTFFRRTILSGRSFTCRRGGNCSFNKFYRCACRACRFVKCVNSGMNPQSIQWPAGIVKAEVESDEDDYNHNGVDTTICCSATAVVKQEPHPVPLRLIGLSDGLMMVHEMVAGLRRREMLTNELREKWTIYTDSRLDDLLNEPCLLGISPCKRLQQWQGGLEEKYMLNPIRYWTVVDLRLTIEYAKSQPIFRELSRPDQRALLSHIGGSVAQLVQAFYSTKMKQNTTVYPDGTVAMKAIDSGRCSYILKNDCRKWVCERFNLPVAALTDVGLDEDVFALLKAVAFFSPLDDLLSEEARRILQREREKYMDSLSRLLFTKEGAKGASKMAALMSALQTLFYINEKKRNNLRLYDVASNLDLSILGREIQLRQHL